MMNLLQLQKLIKKIQIKLLCHKCREKYNICDFLILNIRESSVILKSICQKCKTESVVNAKIEKRINKHVSNKKNQISIKNIAETLKNLKQGENIRNLFK